MASQTEGPTKATKSTRTASFMSLSADVATDLAIRASSERPEKSARRTSALCAANRNNEAIADILQTVVWDENFQQRSVKISTHQAINPISYIM